MSVRFNVAEVVRVLERTLSSTDIRTAFVLTENKWQNVMTVVRLSSDSAVAASVRVDEIWRKHGVVYTEEFRIEHKVVAFAEWTVLLAELSQGQVWFPEMEVEFGHPIDVGIARVRTAQILFPVAPA